MESILDKINEAYAKGINNPRFKEAIEEIITNPEIQDELAELKEKSQTDNSPKAIREDDER